MLHRRPARFDVLFHALAEAIIRRYWYMQTGFTAQTLRLDRDEIWEAAMHMSRAFQKRTSMDAVANLVGGAAENSIFDLDGNLEAVARGAADAMVGALANYVEVTHRAVLKRNHPDLVAVRQRLHDSVVRFLASKCTREGELHPCLENPAAWDEGYFPDNGRAAEPAEPSGNARLDAYRLNVLVHDGDDPVTAEGKLLDYVKSDPLLAPEFAVDLVSKLAALQMQAEEKRLTINTEAEGEYLATRFLFTPGFVNGKMPVELFLNDQLLASTRQNEHLARWVDQNVEGVFRIVSRSDAAVTLEDLTSGREVDVVMHPVFAECTEKSVLRVRLLPWDQLWHILGPVERVEMETEALESYRALLHPLRMRRRADEDDPRLLGARKLVAFVAEQFAGRFGSEAAKFESLDMCRDALAEFHHALMVEVRLADGRQFADAWREDVGLEFPPFVAEKFAAGEEEPDRPAVFYDRDEGMAFVANYGAVEAAMAMDEPDKAAEEAFASLLMRKWRPGWLVRKIALEQPERAEKLIAAILGDAGFRIGRDLEELLGKLKCPDHTLPHRPAPFLID